jgi:hypothetical protein
VRWRKCVERQGDYVEKWYTCVPLLFNKSHVKKYLRFSFDSPSYITLCLKITKLNEMCFLHAPHP